MSDPRRSPLRACVCCLYGIGYGFTTIARITKTNKGLASRWVKQAGITRGDARGKRSGIATIKANAKSRRALFYNPEKMITDDYLKEFRALESLDHLWVSIWKKEMPMIRYYKNHEKEKARSRICAAKYYRRCRDQSPEKLLPRALRARLYKFIKTKTSISMSRLIGCSWDDLKTHIEQRFATGMSWAAWGVGKGKWHLDHRIPCAAFDLTESSERAKCFHFSNLQPLWGCDNISKSNKMPDGTRAKHTPPPP